MVFRNLIACNLLTTGESTVGFLDSADAVWDIEVCSKGGSVVLTYTDDVFPVDSKVHNHVFHKPVVSGYVDMLAPTATPTENVTEAPTPTEEGKVTPPEKVTETPTPTQTPTSVAKSTVTPTPTAVPTVKTTVAPTKAAVPTNVRTATPSLVPEKIKISKATVSKIATQYYFGKA